MKPEQSINEGKTALGIELGSTRIKAVLIDESFTPIAAGSCDWENRLDDGIWTYSLDDIWKGLQASFKSLSNNVKDRYGTELTSIGAIGISAMMHGYLVFDKEDKQLAQFRTWRNTTTGKAANELTEIFQFKIPQRWSIAHLYQAMLNNEPHVKDIAFFTTLAGYVHWKLTGKKVIGIGDASGMFPVDTASLNYNSKMLEKFSQIVSSYNFGWNIKNILPSIVNTGETAGVLSPEGALLLDPDGKLKAGIPFCPPEGDADTGLVATNSLAKRTGNISTGTSVFAIVVLEKDLSKVYSELDIAVSPAGNAIAMVHSTNGTGDIDAWVRLFMEVIGITGAGIDKTDLYSALYSKALEADPDCGNLLSYNYYSGEHLTGFREGRPLFVRFPDSNFTLANFMRTMLLTVFGALKCGFDILTVKENVSIDSLLGHGGLFKTKGVGQKLMAAALNTSVSVMDDSSDSGFAAEGGAWGIALLAAFMKQVQNGNISANSLEQFLAEKVFANLKSVKVNPDPGDVECFKKFMERYIAGLKIEQAAVDNLKK